MQRLVFFLLGSKGYEVLNAIIAGCHKEMVLLVVIGEDKNLQKDYFEEITALCRQQKIKFCTRRDYLEIKQSFEGALAIAAGWRWLINDKFNQLIVFHDSLLPKYRGFNPLVTALLNRDEETGVTAIIANKEFDCGDIIDSKSIKLIYPIKIEDVIKKVGNLYFELAQSILLKLKLHRNLYGISQDNTRASYSVWRDEEDYRINWNASSEAIAHFINCLSFPYKGASAICNNVVIRIMEAEVESDVEIANRDVGKVLFIIDEKPVVICGVGLLRINVAVDDKGLSVLPFSNFRIRLK